MRVDGRPFLFELATEGLCGFFSPLFFVLFIYSISLQHFNLKGRNNQISPVKWIVKNLPPNFEHVAAIQIQRIWRGHRVRRIIGEFFAYVRTQLEKESPISVSEHNAELKNNPRQGRPRIRNQQSQEQPFSTSQEQLSTEQSPLTEQPSIDDRTPSSSVEQSSFQKEFSTGQSSLSEELRTGQFSLAKQTSSSIETFSLAENYSWTKQKSRDITKKPGVEHSYSLHELPTKQVSFAKLLSIERRSFGKLQSTEQSWSGTEQPSLGNKRSLERVSSATQSDIAHPRYTRQQSEDLSLSRKQSITEDSSFKQQPSSDQSLGGRHPSLEHPLVDKWLSSEHLLLARTQSVDLPLSGKQSITSTEQPTPIPPAGTDRPLVQPRTDQSLGEVGTNNTDRLVTQVLKGESVEETQPEKQQESEPLQQTSFQPPREPVLSEKDLSLKTESAEKILTEAQQESKLFQQTNFQQPSELLPERKLSVEKESVQKVQPEELQEQTSLQEPSELLPERKLSVEKESVQKVQPEELQEQTSLQEPSELLPERKLSVEKKSVQKVQPEELQEQTSLQEPSELLPERKLSVEKKSVQKVQPEELQEQTSLEEPSELLPERKLSVEKKSVQKVQPEKLQDQTSLQEPSKLLPEKLFVQKKSVQKVQPEKLQEQTSLQEPSKLPPEKLFVQKKSVQKVQPENLQEQTSLQEPSKLPTEKLFVQKKSVQKVQPEKLQEQTSLQEPSKLPPEKLFVQKKSVQKVQPEKLQEQTSLQEPSELLPEKLFVQKKSVQKVQPEKLQEQTSHQEPSKLPPEKLFVQKKSVQKVQPEKLQEQTSLQEPSKLPPEKLFVQKKSVQKVQPEKLQEQTSLQEPSELLPEKLFVRKSSVQKVAVKLTLFQQTSFEELSELFPGKELFAEKESAHNIQPSVEQQERKIFQQTRFQEPSKLLPERKLSVEKKSVQKVQPEELQEQTSLEELSELLPERKLSVEKKSAEVIQPRTVFRQTTNQPASRLLLERELSAGTIQPQKQRERKLVQPTSFQLPSILSKEASPGHLTADRQHHKPDLKEEPAAKRRKMTKKSAARLALEASYDRYVQKALQQGKASKDMMQFAEYCAYRLQVWWLMKHRKFLRERMMKRSLALQKKMALHSVSDMQVEITEAHDERRRRVGPLTKGDAATSIQRAWRRHIDIQVYRYYRDLINFRTRGDPSVMLRCINPNEANLLEPGSGTAVRFRLAGDRFPPNIYYKIFTHRPIQDLCANSPKDYTRSETKKLTVRHKHNKVAKLPPQEDITQEHWYKRCENNGWRLVSDRLVHHIMNDPVTWESSKKTYHFHHSKLKRKQDVEKHKKSRKIDWMKKMYKEGMLHARADDPETVQLIEGATAGMITTVENQGPEALEDWEVDELLDWTTSLDFEEYFDTWKNLATSAAADNRLDKPMTIGANNADPYELTISTAPSRFQSTRQSQHTPAVQFM